MVDLIANQRVLRRKSSPAVRPSTGGAYRSIDLIKQRPSRKGRGLLFRGIREQRKVLRRAPAREAGEDYGNLNLNRKEEKLQEKELRRKEREYLREQKALIREAARRARKLEKSAWRQEKKAKAPEGGEKPRTQRRFSFAQAGISLVTALLIGMITYFTYALYVSGQEPGINPQEDSLFSSQLASYAGIPEGRTISEGEEIPLDLMETFRWDNYTVQRGDSVSKIAIDHGISMDAIIASNGMTNARRLFPGQVIRIPNMDGLPYTVRKGDSLAKISSAHGVPLSAILDANDIESDDIAAGTVLFIPGARMKKEELKLALGELFVYPLRGRQTSPYGWRKDPISGVRRFHAALDLAAPRGSTIKAAMDGKVSTVGFNSTYGNYVILSHIGGFQTMYAHMSSTSVRKGDYVWQGNKIGEVGSTGYSTGNHLHFAIYKNGRAVNPLDYLNK